MLFRSFLREPSPPLEVLDALAEVALWRALAARNARRPTAPLALEGLRQLHPTLAKGGQHAGRRLLEARLLTLAERGEEARKARVAAAAANPLIKGGAEWRAALAEAGR